MTPYEKEYICKDGSRLPVLVGGVSFQDSPFMHIAFVLNISDRKELEQRKDDFISMASHETQDTNHLFEAANAAFRQATGEARICQCRRGCFPAWRVRSGN